MVEPIGFGIHDEVISVKVTDFVCPPGNGHSPQLRYEAGMMSLGLGQISDDMGDVATYLIF